jgi:mRNA interferase MazF
VKGTRVPTLERGAVVYADLNPVVGHEQAGHRPVLIVSDTRFNVRSGTAIVMPLTSQQPKAGYPFSVEIGIVGAEKRTSYVKPGQVRTISTARLGRLLGHLLDAKNANPVELTVLVNSGTLGSVDCCLDALLQICGRPVAEPAQQNDT